MQMDTFFTMGKSHKVCEDYAVCDYDNDGLEQFIAISDGCSSSKDTDFGSRILLKLFKSHIAPCSPHCAKGLWYAAKGIVEQLNMPTACLDATINFGFTNELNGVKGVEVYTIGDGFIVAELNDGGFVIVEIEYDQNAPYYLSYVFDSARKEQFMKLGQKKIVTVKTYSPTCVMEGNYLSSSICDVAVDHFSQYWFPFDKYKSVSVFSDGLKTFIPTDASQQKLPLEQIVKELITFPVPNGEFIKRRGISFLKKHKDHAFFDDFSMATIVRG